MRSTEIHSHKQSSRNNKDSQNQYTKKLGSLSENLQQ